MSTINLSNVQRDVFNLEYIAEKRLPQHHGEIARATPEQLVEWATELEQLAKLAASAARRMKKAAA